MLNTIDTKKIAERFVESGMIPVECTEEFAEGLKQQMQRESLRFGNGVAAAAAQAIRRGRLTSQPLAA